jgi:large subunit ribosomal protein L5
MKHRLKRFYYDQVIHYLRTQFEYPNIYKIPRLKKIVINRGLGETIQNRKILESFCSELTTIAVQRGVVTCARKDISGFKIRKHIPLGLKVTLRSDLMYAFLDRLINLALPRIRDFQGVRTRSFNKQGDYNIGFEDQLMFPEIRYDQVDYPRGIDLAIVTSSSTDRESFSLLKKIGIPFQNSSTYLYLMTGDTARKILTAIRNSILLKSSCVEVPKTRITEALAKIIIEAGLIESISDSSPSPRRKTKQKPSLFLHLKYRGHQRIPIFTNLQCVSRSSLRVYTKANEIPRILAGRGFIILSTSQGLITGQRARSQRLGGEIICSIWLLFLPILIYESSLFGEKNM